MGTSSGRWAMWVPPTLLLVVAASHAVLVTRYDLSRWLGGGFGMFSTTDSASSRHVHAYILEPSEGRLALSIPDELDEAMRHTRVFPTGGAVQRFAERLARHPSAEGRRVEVEVWQTRYDPVTMAPSSRLVRAAVSGAARGTP